MTTNLAKRLECGAFTAAFRRVESMDDPSKLTFNASSIFHFGRLLLFEWTDKAAMCDAVTILGVEPAGTTCFHQ